MTRKDELSEVKLEALKSWMKFWDELKGDAPKKEAHLRRQVRAAYMRAFIDGAAYMAEVATREIMESVGEELKELHGIIPHDDDEDNYDFE